MNIVFQKSGLSDLTLERGRLLPYSDQDVDINQNRYLTESNNPKITNYGSNLKLVTLSFTYLSKDNFDGAVNGLKTWFNSSTINWSENSFTLIDEMGVSHTVRWWQNKFSMPKLVSGRYKIAFTLKEE